MKSLALWLLPLALTAGEPRYARLGEFEGTVEVQIQAADDWQAARRNLILRESSWVRTEGAARVEVELDEGSILRLGPDSLAELSDYTQLSTGQRVTLISLDHGLAYFTGAAEAKDALMVAVPGAQVTIHEGARLRFEARDPWSSIATADGVARFSSPAAEFDLTEGRMVKLDPARPARFTLNSEIPPLPTDRWSDERDKVLASSGSGARVPGLRNGLADLDAYGTWIVSQDYGFVWKPKVQPGWTPYRNGKWMWYDGLGYTWIADDAWGWLPFHYGRWMQQAEGGAWIWAPGDSTVFKPGEVYWLRNAKLVGWGPLAPGESWTPPDAPRLFASANTTYASYVPDAREIDPAGFARPKEPVAAAFVPALSSPPFPASRLDAFRPPLRAGGTRGVVVESGAAYDPNARAQADPPPSQAVYAPPAVIVQQQQVEVPVEVDVPVPVPVPAYTGIIMVVPPGYKAPPAKKGKPLPAPAPHEPTKPRLPEPDKPK
ncbi:MAG: DUF6600 domain-containing protein [Bryobacteraceae bacterium]